MSNWASCFCSFHFWSLSDLSYESAKNMVKFLTRSFIKNGMIQERLTAIFRHPMINSTYKFKKKGAHYLNDSSLLRCRTRFHTIKIESRPNLKITICDDLKHPWPQFTTWTISSTPLKYWFTEDKSGIKNTQLRFLSDPSSFLYQFAKDTLEKNSNSYESYSIGVTKVEISKSIVDFRSVSRHWK